MCLYSFSSHLG